MRTRTRAGRDQPRTRGEQAADQTNSTTFRGSAPHAPVPPAPRAGAGITPHARGAPERPGPVHVRDGISPARTRSTSTLSDQGGPHRDQPRTRGEHSDCQRRIELGRGSASHARGAPDLREVADDRAGISPAGVGSTEQSCVSSFTSGDQPRTRGEHTMYSPLEAAIRGSAPHARGALREKLRAYMKSGISLARAGSTWFTRTECG